MKKNYLIAIGLIATMLLTGCGALEEIQGIIGSDGDDKQVVSEAIDEENKAANNLRGKGTAVDTLVEGAADTVSEDVEEYATDEALKNTEEVAEDETTKDAGENATGASLKDAEEYVFPETTPGEYDSPRLIEGEELSEAELEWFREYFSSVENYGFTLSSYRTPKDIDWFDVFNCDSAGIHNCEYSKDALYEFMDIRGYDHDSMYIASEDTYEGLSAISGKDVKAFVEAKTGITDFDFDQIKFYTYIEREDVLFKFSDPFIYENEITCLKGVKKDNLVQVEIGFTDDSRFNRRITLEGTGDADNPYHFCSNRQLWEEKADMIIGIKDYETDELLPCSVNVEDNGVILKPIRDCVVCGFAKALIDETDSRRFSSIKEVALRDLDGDGLKDTIAVLDFGGDIVPVVCMGKQENWGVTYCYDPKSSVTEWISGGISDITVDNVINYVMEHQDELKRLTSGE